MSKEYLENIIQELLAIRRALCSSSSEYYKLSELIGDLEDRLEDLED